MEAEFEEHANSSSPASAAVAAYYDEMQRFYQHFWHPSGVHYGLWEAGVHTHDAAVRAMDELVGRSLALPPGSRVLDAGCGIGGSSMHLATRFGLRAVGITISRDQLRRAHHRAQALDASQRPEFHLRSYLRTGLADGSFDGVFGIESVCYAEPRVDFLREAHRLLRPGGRLVVADGFAGEERTEADREDLRVYCEGFALTQLVSVASFVEQAASAGFRDIEVEELTPLVMRSARRILWLSRFGMLLLAVARRFGTPPAAWAAHCGSGLVQQRMLQRRSMRYCRITATR